MTNFEKFKDILSLSNIEVKKLYTKKEAAEILEISEHTLNRWAAKNIGFLDYSICALFCKSKSEKK